jgi:Polysulphide reductase, NrfD
VSKAEVTREGLRGVRPGREAMMWSPNGGVGPERPHDHPGASYYGRPVIKPPVWAERDIAGYLFTGGLAGASSLLAAGADLTGRRRLARRSRLCAMAALGLSFAALVHDLGRPRRILNMLRVVKPTSPMSVGSWILSAYAPLVAGAAVGDVLGVAPRARRAAGLGAGVLGASVATYTAALVANTAVPAWHGGRREMPFLFAGSAASAGGGMAMVAVPLAESGPARRMAVAGALAELAAERKMDRSLGSVAEALHAGKAGKRMRAAKALTAAGALGAATLGRRSRLAAMLSGAALVAGSALTRFGLFEAGMASAHDPRHTVGPQRRRLEERNGIRPSAQSSRG